jgi:hypothetical protein
MSSGMGGIAESLWVPGKVFCAYVNETVIMKAGGEALFSMLCVLINRKSSRSTGFCRAGYKLSLWEVCGASEQATFWPCRGVTLGCMKSCSMLYVAKVLFTD